METIGRGFRGFRGFRALKGLGFKEHLLGVASKGHELCFISGQRGCSNKEAGSSLCRHFAVAPLSMLLEGTQRFYAVCRACDFCCQRVGHRLAEDRRGCSGTNEYHAVNHTKRLKLEAVSGASRTPGPKPETPNPEKFTIR